MKMSPPSNPALVTKIIAFESEKEQVLTTMSTGDYKGKHTS